MRCQPECYPCMENLVRRCISLAGVDPSKEKEVLKTALSYLEQNFSLDSISTDLFGEVQRIIRAKTGNSDPFAAVKDEEIALAQRYVEKLTPTPQASLRELIKIAARGNGFDFFQDLETLEKQLQDPVELARDDSALLEERLQGETPRRIIYLADNAGEALFDLPLLNRLRERAKVYYAVKGSPVQNDLALIDLERSGFLDRFGNVVTTGTDSPGLDFGNVSADFKALLNGSDLILAKGMGHYETLPEYNLAQPVFLIFQVKCRPIARDAALPLHSYAAYFLN
ncbi:MAG: damage-control phosphatase ARMT1 family protein [Dethiobacteria bacterium]